MIIEYRNSQSYNEVMTKLRRICDDFMIIIFFENMATCLLIYINVKNFTV